MTQEQFNPPSPVKSHHGSTELHVPGVMGNDFEGWAPGDQPIYRPSRHSLSCCPYRKTVRVKIVDEEEYERQENFFIVLGEPKWMERGLSGVRFLKTKQNKIKQQKETKFKQVEKQQQQKETMFFSPPFSFLFLLPPFDQWTCFILFPPVFSLLPCFGTISAFLAIAYFHVLLFHLLDTLQPQPLMTLTS